MWRVPKEKERKVTERKLPPKTKRGSCKVDFKRRGRMEEKEKIIDVGHMQVLPAGEWIGGGIRRQQLEDPNLSMMVKFIEENHRPLWSEIADGSPTLEACWTQWDSLYIKEECLGRMWGSFDGWSRQSLVVVPKIKIAEILNKCHEGAGGGHLGVNGTLAKVRERFYWSGCRQSVARWCRRCEKCGATKGPARRRRELVQGNSGEGTIRRIVVDHRERTRCNERANSG